MKKGDIIYIVEGFVDEAPILNIGEIEEFTPTTIYFTPIISTFSAYNIDTNQDFSKLVINEFRNSLGLDFDPDYLTTNQELAIEIYKTLLNDFENKQNN